MTQKHKRCDWLRCDQEAEVVVQVWTDWPEVEFQQFCEMHAGHVESESCWRATYDLTGNLLGEPKRN